MVGEPSVVFVSSSFAQVSIIAQLLDGTGTAYKTGYLHFQLQNCGANIPNVTAGVKGNFIVQDSFDLRPSSLSGPISGSITGNFQILCGNTQINASYKARSHSEIFHDS
jgi:hypothetical protein